MCSFDVSKALIYYSHFPVLFISLFLAFFILWMDRKNPTNRNLFFFVLFFSFWVINDLLQWIVLDPVWNLFLSRISLIGLFALIFLLYFSYSFAKIDLGWKKKLLLATPYIPIALFMFTDYNAHLIDESNCNLHFGALYWYIYLFILTYVIWSIAALRHFHLKKNWSEQEEGKVRIIMGAALFISLWFFLFIAATDISVKFGFPWGDSVFLFAPMGMVVFIGMLVYATAKYQFLNIKLVTAQALTYSIWILIASQYFFAEELTIRLLITLTLFLSVLFGLMLIRVVKQDAKRKEELQQMANKLELANEQLRKLDNAKTEFISIASHQLRTPLTAVKGFISLILEGSYGEINNEVKDALSKAYASSERLIQLVEDLLNVSRIESGRMQFTFEKTDLLYMIKELYDNFILVAEEKGLKLKLDFPKKKLPVLILDSSRIREVISNLIDNALKYTEKGSVTISVKEANPGILRLTVSDTGIGITKEDMPYLFKKFSRGKDTSKFHVNGTGLGLYVGKNIVDAHHGIIWVESKGEGKGSKFIMELPTEPIKS